MAAERTRIRTIIVDDETLARKRLRAMLASEHEIDIVGEAASGTAALDTIAQHKPDLVFLDVQMPGLTGFDVVRALPAKFRPLIVFVTAHDEHAIRAFDVHAADYLLKPVSEARLREAVERIAERLRSESRADLSKQMEQLLSKVATVSASPDRIPIKRNGRVIFVRTADIDWIEADGDVVRLHAGREMHCVRDTLGNIEERLPRDVFVRVHRSIVVNAASIREVQPWFKGDYVLILKDGTQLRSGRSYREAVQSLIRS
jgi:two-component system LytT family response regulator